MKRIVYSYSAEAVPLLRWFPKSIFLLMLEYMTRVGRGCLRNQVLWILLLLGLCTAVMRSDCLHPFSSLASLPSPLFFYTICWRHGRHGFLLDGSFSLIIHEVGYICTLLIKAHEKKSRWIWVLDNFEFSAMITLFWPWFSLFSMHE